MHTPAGVDVTFPPTCKRHRSCSQSLWPNLIEVLFQLSLSVFQVRSVCLSADAAKVLVGTLGSDILELAAVEMPKNLDGESRYSHSEC